MQIKIKAETPLVQTDLNSVVQEVVNKYLSKLQQDSPEVASQLQDDSNSLILLQVQVDLAVKLDGLEELQVLTTDARGTEHPELLVVTAEMDSSGRLDWETVADNEEQSLFTDAEALIAEGLPEEFTEIVSDYYSDQLQEIDSVELSDFLIVIYEALTKEDTVVIHYFTDDRLVQEIELPITENQSIEAIVSHYKQLI